MQQMIAVEKFIDAVRKRPALWDSHSNVYKDRTLKKDGWLEVCQIMCPKFADKSERERGQIDEKRAKIWATAAGRDDLIADISNSPIKGILCGMHFKSEMFTSEKLNRLHKRAIPTIFPSLEESTISSLENKNTVMEEGINQPPSDCKTADRTLITVSLEEKPLVIQNQSICNKVNSSRSERDMQLKWKNLRDAYVRQIRTQLDKYRRNKPMRSYIYNNQMSFLRRVINPRTRSSVLTFESTSQDDVKREEEEDDDDEEDVDLTKEDLMEIVEHDVQSGKEKQTNIEENGEDEDEEELVASADPLFSELNTNVESLDNDDMHFFKSLLPVLQTLKTEQKLKFRIDVMELLMTYHQAPST